MKRDKDLFILRNYAIEQRYKALDKEGFKHKVIINQLSLEFYLAPRTIEGIISGEYEKRNELQN